MGRGHDDRKVPFVVRRHAGLPWLHKPWTTIVAHSQATEQKGYIKVELLNNTKNSQKTEPTRPV